MSNITKTKEKILIGGALAGGLFLFGLMNNFQNPIDHFKNTKQTAPTIYQSETKHSEKLKSPTVYTAKLSEQFSGNSKELKSVIEGGRYGRFSR